MLEIDFLFVFIITCSQLSDFLLSSDTLFLVIEGELLILHGRVQTEHSNIAFTVIEADLVEDLFEAGFGLNSLLLNFSQFLSLEPMDVHLGFEGLLQLSRL